MAADVSPTTATETGLPSGISQPLASINSNDQSGLIAILTAFALGLVILSIAIRVYARHNFSTYRVDDLAFFVASIFAIVQASLVFKEIGEGLGRIEERIASNDQLTIQKFSFASDLLYIIAIFLSKCSTAFLFLYLTPGRTHVQVIWCMLVACLVWLVSSIVLEGIRCHPDRPWVDDPSNCTNSFARWAYIAVLDILIEIGLVATAIYIVWDLQMQAMSKLTVVAAFSCRIPNIAFATARLAFIHSAFIPSTSHFWETRVVSTTQLAIGYSITASIIPYLKPFMQAYENPDISRVSHYKRSGGSSNFKLSALTSKSSATATSTLNAEEETPKDIKPALRKNIPVLLRRGSSGLGRLRPEGQGYSARASVNPPLEESTEEARRNSENGSDNSQQLIIKKGVEWSVQYERDRQSSVAGTAGTRETGDEIRHVERESV